MPGADHLSYDVEVLNTTETVREFVNVDAHSGQVIDQIIGIHEALDREVSETSLTNLLWDESCGDPTIRVTIAPDPALIELKFDQIGHYQDIELRWIDLQDPRCPNGVNCVWGGQILATVEITKSGEPPLQVNLLRQARRETLVSRAFGHNLRLLLVHPHPGNGFTYARSDFRLQLEFTAR